MPCSRQEMNDNPLISGSMFINGGNLVAAYVVELPESQPDHLATDG